MRHRLRLERVGEAGPELVRGAHMIDMGMGRKEHQRLGGVAQAVEHRAQGGHAHPGVDQEVGLRALDEVHVGREDRVDVRLRDAGDAPVQALDPVPPPGEGERRHGRAPVRPVPAGGVGSAVAAGAACRPSRERRNSRRSTRRFSRRET